MPRLRKAVRNTVYVRRIKFFRLRLLTSSPERIVKIVEQNEKEIRAIREDVLKMCWYMRGGLTYEEALNLSWQEREIIGGIIKDNFETTKKTGLPHF